MRRMPGRCKPSARPSSENSGASPPWRLGQIFLQRLPIVPFPSRRQILPQALKETCVIKYEFRAGAFLGQLEFNNRANTGILIDDAPGFDNSLVAHKLDMSPHHAS